MSHIKPSECLYISVIIVIIFLLAERVEEPWILLAELEDTSSLFKGLVSQDPGWCGNILRIGYSQNPEVSWSNKLGATSTPSNQEDKKDGT